MEGAKDLAYHQSPKVAAKPMGKGQDCTGEERHKPPFCGPFAEPVRENHTCGRTGEVAALKKEMPCSLQHLVVD